MMSTVIIMMIMMSTVIIMMIMTSTVIIIMIMTSTVIITRLASSLGEGEYLRVESEQEEDYLIPLQVLNMKVMVVIMRMKMRVRMRKERRESSPVSDSSIFPTMWNIELRSIFSPKL